jgi:hypothetical protein
MGSDCNSYTLTVISALLGLGCFDADPRDVRGALDAAARAIEADDGEALYRVIDQRSRHALEAIVKQRQAAAALIRAYYPAAEQAQALHALGDAAEARSGAALFAGRCARPCRARFAKALGAPVSQQREGPELVVTTAQGEHVRLYHGSDTWYGLVWNIEALDRERTRAAQELLQIEDNASVYRKRRSLERTASGSDNGQPASGRSR